jgi:hypothetical protein
MYPQEEINEMQAEIKQVKAERDLKAAALVELRSEVEELRTALARLQTLATDIVYGNGMVYKEPHFITGREEQATCTCCLSSAENANQIRHEAGCQAVLLQNYLTELNRGLSGSCYED